MVKNKQIKGILVLIIVLMIMMSWPLRTFANSTVESRLSKVDFSTAIDLSPAFSPDVYIYSATVHSTINSLSLTPYSMTSEATVSVNGSPVPAGAPSAPVTLQYGENKFFIEVKSTIDAESKKNYEFSINRLNVQENADLTGLTIEGAELNQPFSSEITSYSAWVPYSKEFVVIRPTAYNNAIIKVNGESINSNGYSVVDLVSGSNLISCVVQTQSGVNKTYIIEVNRRTASKNANINNIVIGGKTYSEIGSTYVGYVNSTANSIDIIINASDSSSTIDIKGKAVSPGKTVNLYLEQEPTIKFPITVSASNGTTVKLYNLYIIRENQNEVITSSQAGTTGSSTNNIFLDTNGSINLTDGKGATTVVTKPEGVKTYKVSLQTEALKQLINANSNSALIVVDYTKLVSINDVLTLEVDGALSQLLQSKKIPIKLMALNGYLTIDLSKLNGWSSGGSVSISRSNIGANFGNEHIPATGFINFTHTGTVSPGTNPLSIEIPVFSDVDMKLANVYQYDGSSFNFVPSSTYQSLKKADSVTAGDYIVMNFKKNFTDIQNHWSYTLLDLLAKKQFIMGYPDSTFRPDNYITRSEFTAMLTNATGEKLKEINFSDEPFTDVHNKNWFYNAVNSGWRKGIVTGITPTTFEPDRNITREEMAIIAVRTLSQMKTIPNLTVTQAENILKIYKDSLEVSSWANIEMATAINTRILQGDGQNRLAAKSLATRAQAAVIIYKILDESGSL